jgi:hypothetical protein
MARTATLVRPERSASLVTDQNSIQYDYKSLDEAFPKIEPGIKPFGTYALFQIRHAKRFTKGGLELVESARSTEYYNTQIAKCIALGQLCFKVARNVDDPISGEPAEKLFDYAEGPWFKPGDFVRIPKYGGDRFTAPHTYKIDIGGDTETVHEDIIFVMFKAKDILGLVTGDPLSIRAFYE